MKVNRFSLWLFAGTALLQACASTVKFLPSTIVPAASGTVQTKRDKNKNYAVQVRLLNLADPQNLDPARKTYLVWMEADGVTQKLGQVTPYSKQLKADLKATTTAKPSQVFLTAEDDAQVSQATGPVILSTDGRQR